jgi:hypothetical protein
LAVLPSSSFDGDARPLFGGFGFDHRAAGFAGHRVHLFLHGFPGNEVAELDGAATSVIIGVVNGSQTASRSPGFHLLALFDHDVGAVDDRTPLAFTSGFADDGELAAPAVHDHQFVPRHF